MRNNFEMYCAKKPLGRNSSQWRILQDVAIQNPIRHIKLLICLNASIRRTQCCMALNSYYKTL